MTDKSQISAGATDRFDYAKNVVVQTLKSSQPAWFWYGSYSGMTRFFDTFLWRKVWVSIPDCASYCCLREVTDCMWAKDTMMWNMFGLEKLRNAHAKSIKDA